jgi:hypothetical protein
MAISNLTIPGKRRDYTALPKTLTGRQRKAAFYLDHFAALTSYRHGGRNPYLAWLRSGPKLPHDFLIRFFNYWYPVSRHQPQILLQIASAFSRQADRRLVMRNYFEEDGMAAEHHDPHYDLLENFIERLGGHLDVDEEAEKSVQFLHDSMAGMTAAQATGYLCAIEHPALDISSYFCELAKLAGREDLLSSDPYLSIHIDVEPSHIVWSHGNALSWMNDHARQRSDRFSGNEVAEAFTTAMAFWENFWAGAFAKLGYRA